MSKITESTQNLQGNDPLLDWIPCAKMGSYPQGDLTGELFDELVRNFDAARHEPPVLVGHSAAWSDDEPAYGWVSAIKREGEVLFLKFKEFSKDLAEAIKAGRYKKRSIAFRRDAEEKAFLFHLAWLGAVAPACKGLPNVYKQEYKDSEESEKVFEFSDIETEKNRSTPEVKTFTEQEVEALKTAEREKLQTEFSEKTKEVETKTAEKTRKEVEAEYSQKLESERKLDAHKKNVDAVIEKAFAEKKINPAQVEPLRAIGYSLADSKELNYSETVGETKTDVKVAAFAALCKVIENYSTAPDASGELEAPENSGAKKVGEYSDTVKKEVEKLAKEEGLTYGQAMKKFNSKK
jgi:hypothetical protein